ncbi:FkbM family methyltransferase [Herbaspirillum sp. alder98]|uniref:FkbM family methyltransferase n=1 Tax=Herbaspirillum sp. alder98 TaxID=2913096 RepID=UPI001CD85CA4|nr:FkbM family methyltransferase [Herbaspirillum sp. alder98]MCA1323386.1 FkbM family methyltransferase [Herbaspirillum sp. alder98]
MSETQQPAGILSPTVLKQCRHGPLLFLREDMYIGRSLDLYGEFSELEAVLFAQIVRAGDVVVEVGANIGAHTVHLAQLVGPAGRVHAYEPQRVIFQMLCANVALNSLFNVHTHHAGVGAAAGQLYVPALNHAAVNNFGGLSLSSEKQGEPVPVVALDALELPSLKLLKIDVEGMEHEVLSGARQLIMQHRPLLYVENDRREKSAALITLIDALGYEMVWHLPRLYNENNFAGNPDNVFANIVSANLLCVPKEAGMTLNGFQKVTGPDDWWLASSPASPSGV